MSEQQKDRENFAERCEQLADAVGVELDMYDDEHQQEPFEDDGSLHIVQGGQRACFDVSNGQTLSAAKQNANSALILTTLGYPVTERTRA